VGPWAGPGQPKERSKTGEGAKPSKLMRITSIYIYRNIYIYIYIYIHIYIYIYIHVMPIWGPRCPPWGKIVFGVGFSS